MQVEKPPSIASEVQQLQEVESTLGEIIKHCNKMKSDFLQYSQDPTTELTSLRNGIESLAELQKQIVGLSSAASQIEEMESDSGEEEDVLRKFDSTVQSCKEEEKIDDYAERAIRAVEEYITRSQNPDDYAERAIRAVEEYITRSQNPDQSLDELLVTETAETLIDPLTKSSIKDLVRSVVCNHKYERASILKYLERPQICPYSGCSSILSRTDIVDDLQLQANISKLKNET